jgi:hypothetical protein
MHWRKRIAPLERRADYIAERLASGRLGHGAASFDRDELASLRWCLRLVAMVRDCLAENLPADLDLDDEGEHGDA